MGQIVRYNLSDGKSFRAYIPDNVTNDTSIFYYSYVVGNSYESDSLWQGYEENMINQNSNSIIIIPEDRQLVVGSENSGHIYQENAMEAIDIIEKQYNITNTNFYNGGFSAGFGFSVRTLAHYLKENPDAKRQTLIAVDGVMNDTTNICASELEAIKNNNSIILSYTQPQNFEYQAKKLKETGLPILYVVDPTVPENSGNKYWGYHDYMTKNFFDSGLYEELINFVDGKGKLPENYTYRVYDPQSGTIREINREEVAEFLGIEIYEIPENITFSNLSSLSDFEIKADSDVFANHLNNIKDKIIDTSLLSGTQISSFFTSTTNIPSRLPIVVSNFFDATSTLLTKLANDILQFSLMQESVDNLNKELTTEATNLTETQTTKTTEQTKEVYQTETSTQTPTNNITYVTNTSNNTQYTQNTTYPTNQTIKEEYNPLTDFPKYKELYSDNNKVVYESTNEDLTYKVIIHKEDNNIVGIEHYYDFKTEEQAKQAIELIEEEYKDNEFIKEIIQKDQYLKITFKEDLYKDLSISEVKEKYYSDLSEITKIESM